METIGSRIRRERSARKLTQEQLGAACGVSKSAVNQWENDNTVPTGPNWVSICAALNVRGEWLKSGKGDKQPSAHPELSPVGYTFINVPLISWVEAGTMWEIADPYVPGDAYDWIPMPLDQSTVLALRVRGSSMNRIAPEDSIIVVNYADRELVSGKYYVIADADGNATFKRYRAEPPRFEPYSTDEHETVFPEPGWRVIGRVIRVETDL